MANLIQSWFGKTRNVQKPKSCSYLIIRYLQNWLSEICCRDFWKLLGDWATLEILEFLKYSKINKIPFKIVKISHALAVPNLVDQHQEHGLHRKVDTETMCLWSNQNMLAKSYMENMQFKGSGNMKDGWGGGQEAHWSYKQEQSSAIALSAQHARSTQTSWVSHITTHLKERVLACKAQAHRLCTIIASHRWSKELELSQYWDNLIAAFCSAWSGWATVYQCIAQRAMTQAAWGLQ